MRSIQLSYGRVEQNMPRSSIGLRGRAIIGKQKNRVKECASFPFGYPVLQNDLVLRSTGR